MNQVPPEDKAAMPVRKDICVTKGDILVPPVTPILATRPKRIIKPSLKVTENLGLV